jgi:sterol desaturase/sphingolipid hydroxylase (fatty acid hydroxylase superfamily)
MMCVPLAPPAHAPAAGHAGYELSPFIPTLEGMLGALTTGGKGSRWHNTVQHHDLHHRFPNRHFSLYFTHWDRWCGTLHEAYDKNLFTYF